MAPQREDLIGDFTGTTASKPKPSSIVTDARPNFLSTTFRQETPSAPPEPLEPDLARCREVTATKQLRAKTDVLLLRPNRVDTPVT
jgi:hypothetical protein